MDLFDFPYFNKINNLNRAQIGNDDEIKCKFFKNRTTGFKVSLN